MLSSRSPVSVVALCLLVWAGCGGPGRTGRGLAPRVLSAEPVQGVSVEERAIACRVYGSGPETVLIVGAIHGNEPASGTLAWQLWSHLEGRPSALDGTRCIVVPVANPDGLARNTRTNARGVDLNRNFATPNWRRRRTHGPKPLSEPETHYIADLIRRHTPDRIVQIHQPLNCVDWDGPARALAEAMARAARLPVRKLGAQAGSLGSFAGVERGIPTITLELPRSASRLSPSTLWQRYGEALLVAVRSQQHAKPFKVGGSLELRAVHTR